MESKFSKTHLANSNTLVQSSHLSGFKFSSIGQGPSLLERMSDSLPNRPSQSVQVQNPSQDQHNVSHTRPRPTLPQRLVIGAPSVETGQTAKPIPTQRANSLVPPSTSLTPSDVPSEVRSSQPVDPTRASAFPELKYPTVTPDIESPVSWESNIALPQPAPMDQDSPRSHPPDSRNQPPVPVPTRIGAGVVDGATDSSAFSFPSISPQNTGETTLFGREQVHRPVEHLFRLAAAREERLSKQREIFDLRSSEHSTFCTEAVHAVQDIQDKIESLKQQGEEMRAQAEQTLQEAGKMREMADSLISSAGTLSVDILGAKNHVGRAVDRSEQIARFVRKSFDWLATLRGREQEKIALVQTEIAEQELAEVVRRQQELQEQLERRKIEEQQKKEAAQREEEAREALRKKAEEENEAARKRSYEMRRAEVMAEKWRATQAHAQSIQAERERRTIDASASSSAPSTRGSHPVPSISPGPNSEFIQGTGVSTSAISSQFSVPTPSRSPVARTGEVPETAPPSHTLPSSNKVKAPPLVSFVPARTEVGRAVNTDSPLSSTTLASELPMRNVVEPSQHSRFNQATRDPSQEQIQPQMPRQAAPTLVMDQVEVKREPSVEVLPATRLPLSDNVNIDQSHHHQRVVSFSTASHHGSVDQHAPISSNFESRVIEDHNRLSDPPVSPQNNHPRDFIYDHVAPSTNAQAYRRQDSISSDQSPPRRNYRDWRPSSSPSSRERRSRSPSRSPPYQRKRTRSRTPLRYEPRQGRWPPERSRVRPRLDDDRDRSWRYDSYDRGRRGDGFYRYRPPPPRRNVYKPSHSPPPSPRHYRSERSPSPRHDYRHRTPAAQHVPQRFTSMDARDWRQDDYRPNANARQYEPTYDGADTRRITELDEQQRWQQQERQRHSPSPSEHDRTPTPPPRLEEAEIDLLDRINMEEAGNRGRGRGRPPGVARGGPNPRRGIRGGFSNGRGRGGVSGPAPALLSRMTETTTRPGRAAPAPSLSDRMEQD